MAQPSPFEIRSDGKGRLTYWYEDAQVFRVRDDNTSGYTGGKPRQNQTLKCPPMMIPAFVQKAAGGYYGTTRTRMARNGWTETLQYLNGDKWGVAVDPGLSMFNDRQAVKNPDTPWPERDKMESLFFGCNLVRAVPSESDPTRWARIITLDYEAGPPDHFPTFAENPVLVQKFTQICRKGVILSRNPVLYYPVVCAAPIFMHWSWLEPYTPESVTQPPPVLG